MTSGGGGGGGGGACAPFAPLGSGTVLIGLFMDEDWKIT